MRYDFLIETYDTERIKVISAPPLFNVPSEITVTFDPQDVVVLPE